MSLGFVDRVQDNQVISNKLLFTEPDKFKDRKSCMQMIKNFSAYNGSNCAVVPSASGATGFTFFCHFPENNKMTRFVAKWQPKEQCQVERIGALFFRTLGLSPPIPHVIDRNHQQFERDVQQFGQLCAGQNPAFGSLADSYPVMLMPHANGNNFKDAVINSKILSLSQESQKEMLREFGKIALLDIVLGNNDRFISFGDQYDEKTGSYLKEIGSFNSGNILLIFEQQLEKLRAVCPIDNCTLNMADPIQRSYGSVGCSIFGNDTDDEKEEESLDQRTTAVDFNEKIENLNRACQWCLQNIDSVVQHISLNIEKDLKKHAGDEIDCYAQFIGLMREEIRLGMQEGFEMCKQFDWDRFEHALPRDLGPFPQRALDLIKRNLETAQRMELSRN